MMKITYDLYDLERHARGSPGDDEEGSRPWPVYTHNCPLGAACLFISFLSIFLRWGHHGEDAFILFGLEIPVRCIFDSAAFQSGRKKALRDFQYQPTFSVVVKAKQIK